jgi:hypothetical protein
MEASMRLLQISAAVLIAGGADRQLQNSCLLAFAYLRQQADFAIGKLKGIVMSV